jgi:hypothetical protein
MQKLIRLATGCFSACSFAACSFAACSFSAKEKHVRKKIAVREKWRIKQTA